MGGNAQSKRRHLLVGPTVSVNPWQGLGVGCLKARRTAVEGVSSYAPGAAGRQSTAASSRGMDARWGVSPAHGVMSAAKVTMCP